MEPFEDFRGRPVYLAGDNINTDQIIPSREMRNVGRSGLSAGLFANLRYADAAQGGRTPDPDFVLNTPGASGANILLSGKNFGCGSSREHAVWALCEFGFRVVVTESFGSIFHGNCVANGLLPVTLGRDAIARLADATQIEVSLENCAITGGDRVIPFDIDPVHREMLREGLTLIDLTLRDLPAIEAFIATDRAARGWAYDLPKPPESGQNRVCHD